MHSVEILSFSFSTVTVVRMFFSVSSESAINTVSTAYLTLFMLLPPTLTPSWCFMFRSDHFAVDIEEAWRRITQPCLTPLQIGLYTLQPSSILIVASCSQHKFLMTLRSFPSQLRLSKMSNRSAVIISDGMSSGPAALPSTFF